MSLQYIESCTLISLDKKHNKPRGRRVSFNIESNQVAAFSKLNASQSLDAGDCHDDTTDQEDFFDKKQIERPKRKRYRRERRDSQCQTISIEVPNIEQSDTINDEVETDDV